MKSRALFAVAGSLLLTLTGVARAEEAAATSDPQATAGETSSVVTDAYGLATAGDNSRNALRNRYPGLAAAAGELGQSAADLYLAARGDVDSRQPVALKDYFKRVEHAHNDWLGLVYNTGGSRDAEVIRAADWIDATFEKVREDFVWGE